MNTTIIYLLFLFVAVLHAEDSKVVLSDDFPNLLFDKDKCYCPPFDLVDDPRKFKIFISAQQPAELIQRAIRHTNTKEIFYNPGARMNPGEILKALYSTQGAVVVLTPTYFDNEWCREEFSVIWWRHIHQNLPIRFAYVQTTPKEFFTARVGEALKNMHINAKEVRIIHSDVDPKESLFAFRINRMVGESIWGKEYYLLHPLLLKINSTILDLIAEAKTKNESTFECVLVPTEDSAKQLLRLGDQLKGLQVQKMENVNSVSGYNVPEGVNRRGDKIPSFADGRFGIFFYYTVAIDVNILY